MANEDEKAHTVIGMSCGGCARSVTEEVSELAGVSAVEADHNTGRLVVRGDRVDDAAVRAAVTEAGYEARGEYGEAA